ncbi:MAG: SDR family NAD(P)-dependent oxidoreductase [Nocardioides sp.]|nr:SDR family NAD(P)-dependent oxidoreductase [Nocardioides sp.]
MTPYEATKRAVEGYFDSLDHEVREYGVRVLLVQPGYTSTALESNTQWPDSPLPGYADQREIAGDVVPGAMRDAADHRWSPM